MFNPARRDVLGLGLGAALIVGLPVMHASAQRAAHLNSPGERENNMGTITTSDGVEIFYKDWGPKTAQPIVFHHGWPLSSDDWDAQMLYFVGQGYRVIAHDRRGHGRSAQVSDSHDMDHYAADIAAVVEHLDLRNAVHIGHSIGGGEATRYVARHGQPQGRVAKLVLIGAVPPIMVATPFNSGGIPLGVFDSLRAQLAGNRSQFYYDFARGPFYG
jgi:non-heme chloroperoxidase